MKADGKRDSLHRSTDNTNEAWKSATGLAVQHLYRLRADVCPGAGVGLTLTMAARCSGSSKGSSASDFQWRTGFSDNCKLLVLTPDNAALHD